MHSSVQAFGDNRVKLTVEVDEEELEPEINAAFRRIARQVRIPGFRPGRVPRRILEARLGHQAGRAEALRSCLPDYYERAVIERGVDTIDLPEIEIVHGSEAGPLRFDAVVQVRPAVTVSGYDGLRVEVPSPAVSPEEVDTEIDGFRRQFAEAVVVARPAVHGDHLRIDTACTLDGDEVVGLNTSDYCYELDGDVSVPEIRDNLIGASAGDILAFDAAYPYGGVDGPMHCRVLVKEVMEIVLPEFDDEFVSANSEHDTVDEFRESAREDLSSMRVSLAVAARSRATENAIVALVDEKIPEGMIQAGAKGMLSVLQHTLRRRGYTLEEYLSATGGSEHDLVNSFEVRAAKEARIDLALRAVAAAEGLEIDGADLDVEIRRIVAGSNATDQLVGAVAAKEVAVMRELLSSSGRLQELKAALSKKAARAWIEERVVLVDADGMEIVPELVDLIDSHSEPGEDESEGDAWGSPR